MALYLGGTKVSPSLNTIILRTITQDNSGNTISQTQTIDTSYTTEDPDNLTAELPIVTEWTRPSAWPNLSALTKPDEGIYLTYDNTSDADFKWASFMCRCNTGNYRIAQGHMNGNSWVQDTYWDVATGSYKEIDYHAAAYNYVVFKITPASTNHITEFYFARVGQATLGTYALRQQHDQYCLERMGKLPYLTTTNGSGRGTNHAYCCQWLEHDDVQFGNAITSLACAWWQGRSLKKIEFGNWTGENCNIISLSDTFNGCCNIEKLDLSQWDTTNWHVTSLSNTFYICTSLRILIVPFNTTNWGNASNKTITLSQTWMYCYSLEELDLSSWDTSQWVNTSLQYTWYYCFRLKKLNVKNWDTLKWTVTSLLGTWCACQVLVDINLSNWNTTNWTVGRMDSCWASNFKRRNFNDIKNWKTANWHINQMSSAFDSCYSVQELDLSGWDTSSWTVSTLASTWSNCRALRHLKVGTWDTSKWAVTTINNIFNYCISLENTEFLNWDTSNWAVTSLSQSFYHCHSLKELNLNNWNMSNWAVTNIGYMTGYCYALKKLNYSNLNLSNVTVANYGSNATTYSTVMECYSLEELNLPTTFAGHINFRYCYKLSHNEIVRIFNALPTALSGAKIVITEQRYKLTNAEIAIATNKGYTVS